MLRRGQAYVKPSTKACKACRLSVLAARIQAAQTGNRRTIRQGDLYAYHPVSASANDIGHSGRLIRTDRHKDRDRPAYASRLRATNLSGGWVPVHPRLLGL